MGRGKENTCFPLEEGHGAAAELLGQACRQWGDQKLSSTSGAFHLQLCQHSEMKVLEFHWEWRKTFLRTLLESMAVCRMDLYLGFMLISFFFYSRFLGLKLPMLGQTQKWRNFKRRRWTWDGGSAPLTVGLNPSPSRLMCMRGGLISPRKRVLSLIFSLHSSSPGCLQESRRGRRWPDCGCRGKRRICNYSVNSHKWWFCSQKSGLLSIRFTNRRG